MSNEKSKRNEYRKGRRNLLFALAVSVPGPVALAISMLSGTSATELADLIRRSCELLSILLAYLIFEITHRRLSEKELLRARLEAGVKYSTGLVMCFSGAVMIYVAIASFGGEKGGVTTSLILAILGAIINARLYMNYKTMKNAVLSVQARLHRVKMLLDCFMVLLLLVWILSPSAVVKNYADLIGSCMISLYIILNGIRVMLEKGEKA